MCSRSYLPGSPVLPIWMPSRFDVELKPAEPSAADRLKLRLLAASTVTPAPGSYVPGPSDGLDSTPRFIGSARILELANAGRREFFFSSASRLSVRSSSSYVPGPTSLPVGAGLLIVRGRPTPANIELPSRDMLFTDRLFSSSS